ncbi:MAG: domain containing protein [Chloroflexi bacterium]|nr:domain containing protein [Chloroflexota bacterium]
MARVAFSTFGIMREKSGHPQVQGFLDRISATFAAADAAPGFLGGPDRNGALAPSFLDPALRDQEASTVSLWEDLHSVWAFAYRGLHAEALQHRREWFGEPAWPNYVAWWVEDDHMPSWPEAAERYQHLHDHGSTAFAFTFKKPFGADGGPLTQRDVTTPAQTSGSAP